MACPPYFTTTTLPWLRPGEDGDLLRVADRVVGAHDPARADLPAGRHLVERDVWRGGVLVHVLYAEFSCT